MLSYATTDFDTKLGWFRNSETDLGQGHPGGSLTPNLLTCSEVSTSSICNPAQAQGAADAGSDVDMVMLYNQIRGLPKMVVEPYYVLYSNRLPERANPGLYTPKSASPLRHMVGLRAELRDDNWDFVQEMAYQFGRTTDGLGFDNQRTSRSAPGNRGPGSAISATTTAGNLGPTSAITLRFGLSANTWQAPAITGTVDRKLADFPNPTTQRRTSTTRSMARGAICLWTAKSLWRSSRSLSE